MSGAAIKEGDIVRNFSNVDKLIIPTSGGEDSLWVPKSAIKLTSMRASENGEYDISDAYGWGRASVNVRTRREHVSGLRNGTEVIVRGGENGTGLLTVEELPSSIVITTPPTRTEFELGEEIDLSGIVVTLLALDGTTWTSDDYPDGIVPVDELTATPGTATEPKKVKTSDFGLEVDALYSDDFPVTADIHIIRYSTNRHSLPPYDNSSYQSMETDRFHGRWDEPAIYPYAALVQSTPANETYNGEITETYDDYRLCVAGASREYASESDGYYHYPDYYVHNHKSIWLNGPIWWGAGNHVIINPDYNLYAEYETETNVPIITTDGTHKIAQYLWTAIYGEPRYIKEIVVSWTRPQDGKVLNAAYIIDVTGVEEE